MDLVGHNFGRALASGGRDTSKSGAALRPAPAATWVMCGRDAGAAWITWISASYDAAGAGYATGVPTPVSTLVPGSVFALAEVL